MKQEQEPVHILVADDDPLVRDMIAIILQDEGYHVDTAEHGAEALKKFSSGEAPGLIVSDMNMPEMDGLALITAVRETGSDVPIIILTGNSEVTTAIQALKTGASDYILKDENIQDTIGIAVEKALEQHFLRKQNQELQAEVARNHEKLEHEKALAQKVQKNILPRDLRFPGFDVGSFYRPSDKIGGDFFDAWENSGRIHFLIGDVSGHSTSSALIMAVSKGILQSLGHTLHDPREIVQTANRMICNIVSDSGMFLTLLYGIFDRAADELTIVSAGHNPVFIVKASVVTAVDSTGPVIGWDPEDLWEATTVDFSAGATLVLYTDGLTEAKNKAGDEFGEERLAELLQTDQPAELLISRIMQQVETFCTGEFPDDLTLLVLKRGEAVAGPAFSMKIEPTFENVSVVRHAVQESCGKHYPQAAAEPLIEELLMAATEAMNNAVEHACTKEVEIELVAGAQGLIFRAISAGERFTPPAEVAFPDLDSPEGLPEGGFGLALIREMVDVVAYDYHDGKNIITLTKYIPEG